MRLSFLLFGLISCVFGQDYDVVIRNGRVMDPESGLDGVRQIGIRGGRVSEISQRQMKGLEVIDAQGLVVAPGFIDLHSHGQTDENYRLKARDGVTTALEMEVGVNPVAKWYAARDGNALINFGASSGHIPARMAVMADTGDFLPRDHAVKDTTTAAQRTEILRLVRQGLDDGGLGVGLGIAYVPAASRAEILDLFELAGKRRMACFVHMRNPGPIEPGVVDALQEVLADAAATGAGLHVVHITSMAFRQTDLCLRMIHGAHQHGVDVTTEAYPYTAGMTSLETAIFDPGWQQRLGIGFGDLQWIATGERLTEQSFERYRKQGGMVILHSIPEEVVRSAMADPAVMIASDGLITGGKGHPRGAGTYARVLAKYVREEHALTLMEAIRKMSLMPAQRLEVVSPAMRNKGRIRVGADADITVFDANKVQDEASYERPALASTGIEYVMVNGTVVVRNGELVSNVHPGRGVKSGAWQKER